MASIFFVGPYPPIMCGIATYTDYLTQQCPPGQWSVLSFDLDRYGSPLTDSKITASNPVWYGIPNRNDFSAQIIRNGLKHFQPLGSEAVLWFQHETAIWADHSMFVTMLSQIDMPSIATLHTLHFQSEETPSGLRKYQYDLLQNLLPHVDALTVFTYGVYRAVISAFPEYHSRIFIVKHGIHSYPEISRLTRLEARQKLSDFLLYESELDQTTKKELHQQKVFTDPYTILLGQTGFLCPLKYSESLYTVRNRLQKMIPNRKIVALRIGTAREEGQIAYARKLRSKTADSNAFLAKTWLPQDILPLAQRAFDINFYWPDECTQSGVLAHALGTGAIIAGRELEGVGETLKESGQLADTDIGSLVLKMRDVILNPELTAQIEKRGLEYAERFSWKNQARRHYELTELVLRTLPLWEKPMSPYALDTLIASTARRMPRIDDPFQRIEPSGQCSPIEKHSPKSGKEPYPHISHPTQRPDSSS